MQLLYTYPCCADYARGFEAITHFIIRDHRYIRREWFRVDLRTAKRAIHKAADILNITEAEAQKRGEELTEPFYTALRWGILDVSMRY